MNLMNHTTQIMFWMACKQHLLYVDLWFSKNYLTGITSFVYNDKYLNIFSAWISFLLQSHKNLFLVMYLIWIEAHFHHHNKEEVSHNMILSHWNEWIFHYNKNCPIIMTFYLIIMTQYPILSRNNEILIHTFERKLSLLWDRYSK